MIGVIRQALILGAATVGMSGCGAYRMAALQGASDMGAVAGQAVGLPLGAAAVALDESFKTVKEVYRQPRLYERTESGENLTAYQPAQLRGRERPFASRRTAGSYSEPLPYEPGPRWIETLPEVRPAAFQERRGAAEFWR